MYEPEDLKWRDWPPNRARTPDQVTLTAAKRANDVMRYRMEQNLDRANMALDAMIALLMVPIGEE